MLEAKYAKNLFQQNRYSVFDSHVMHMKTAHNNEMGVNTKESLFFSLRDLFIFCGLTENFLFIRDGEEWGNRNFFVYSGWGRVGVIE